MIFFSISVAAMKTMWTDDLKGYFLHILRFEEIRHYQHYRFVCWRFPIRQDMYQAFVVA